MACVFILMMSLILNDGRVQLFLLDTVAQGGYERKQESMIYFL